MSFTSPPQYDEVERLADYIGQYGILEPVDKEHDIRAKFGLTDAWDCILWTYETGQLVPHTGIRVFNKRLMRQLDAAHKANAPIVGLLEAGQKQTDPAIKVVDDESKTIDQLKQAWVAKFPNG